MQLFRNWSPARAAFSLAVRSADQMFSGGKWEIGRGESRAFFVTAASGGFMIQLKSNQPQKYYFYLRA